MKTRILFWIAVLVVIINAGKANATTNTWLGLSTSWNTTTNWSQSHVPTSSEDVVITLAGILNNPTISTTAGACKTLTISGLTTTLTLNGVGLTVSGAISISTNTTLAGTGTLSGTSTLAINSVAFTVNTPVSVSGAATLSSGSTLTTTAAVSAASMAVTGSTVALGSTLTLTGALTATSSSTITSTTGSTISAASLSIATGTYTLNGLLTISGTMTVTGSTTITTNATGNTIGSSLSVGQPYALTWNGSGTTTLTGAPSFAFNASFTIGTGNTIKFAANTTIDYTGTQKPFTNNGNLYLLSGCTLSLGQSAPLVNSGTAVVSASNTTFNLSGSATYIDNSATFNATACTFNFVFASYIKNSGTSGKFTTQSGCIFNLSNTSAYILNTSAYYYDHGSTYNLSGYTSSFQNTGSSAVVTARGTTFEGGANAATITNSGTFTIDSTSYINLDTYQDGLTNTGVFNAGTSGSSCTITISAQGCYVTNTGSSSQSAYFNLGSTSIIDLSGGYQPTVTNTSNAYSFFTLMSDALGSAAFDQISSTGYSSGTVAIAGTYNVQRFVSGGNLSTNRGYRVFSSPTNITNSYSTSTTYTNYITLNTLKNSYTVYSSLTANTSYAGAFTAGPSGGTGFSYINPNNNSIIYFYDETKAVSNTSFSSGKHIGVTAIGASTVTLNGVGAVSMPVGNGYLMYYVGPNSRTDGTTGNPLDCYITNVGYINQGDVTVALWYTPKNGSSTASTGKLSYSLSTLTGGAGYNMVGNPYPSTINIATLLGHNSNISTAYLLSRSNSSGQSYYAYTANGTSAPGIGYALSGEGFLIRTTSGSNSLTFKETDKVATQQLTGSNLLMSAPKAETLTINGTGKFFKSTGAAFAPQTTSVKESDAQGNPLTGLYVKIEKDSLSYDYCGVYFRNDWKGAFNENLDALDLDASSSSVLLSSLSSDGMRAAVKHFPDYKKGVSIKLYANGKTNGLYKLKIEGIRNIDTNNYKITLLDHFKKDSLDIGRYKSYAFNILKSDTGTFGANRFELSIQQLPANARYQFASFTAQKATDGVLLTWRAYNEGDNYFYTLEKQQADGTGYTSLYQVQSNGGTIYKYTDKIPNTGNNIYRLKQVDLFGNVTYTALVSIYYDKSGNASMFTLYPNPTVETINVNVTYGKTSSTATGSYKLNIYDVTGSLVTQKTADNSSFSQNVSEFKPGVYIVELKDNQGSSLGKAKFLKK